MTDSAQRKDRSWRNKGLRRYYELVIVDSVFKYRHWKQSVQGCGMVVPGLFLAGCHCGFPVLCDILTLKYFTRPLCTLFWMKRKPYDIGGRGGPSFAAGGGSQAKISGNCCSQAPPFNHMMWPLVTSYCTLLKLHRPIHCPIHTRFGYHGWTLGGAGTLLSYFQCPRRKKCVIWT